MREKNENVTHLFFVFCMTLNVHKSKTMAQFKHNNNIIRLNMFIYDHKYFAIFYYNKVIHMFKM